VTPRLVLMVSESRSALVMTISAPASMNMALTLTMSAASDGGHEARRLQQ
jgi:hypothetical protein